MREGIPVVLSTDDPTFWGTEGAALDFAFGFLAFQLDLKDVKQMAINSIKQSAVDEELKEGLLEKLYSDWDEFIQKIVEEYVGS